MGFARRGVAAHCGGCGAADPGHGEGEDGDQAEQFGRDGQPGVLDIEASGLGIAEHAFDGPAFAIEAQGICGGQIASRRSATHRL